MRREGRDEYGDREREDAWVLWERPEECGECEDEWALGEMGRVGTDNYGGREKEREDDWALGKEGRVGTDNYGERERELMTGCCGEWEERNQTNIESGGCREWEGEEN